MLGSFDPGGKCFIVVCVNQPKYIAVLGIDSKFVLCSWCGSMLDLEEVELWADEESEGFNSDGVPRMPVRVEAAWRLF